MAAKSRQAIIRSVAETPYVREEVPVTYERRKIATNDTTGQRLVRVWHTTHRHLTMRMARVVQTQLGFQFEELMCQHPGGFDTCIAAAEERRRKWLRGMKDVDDDYDEGFEWDYDRSNVGSGGGAIPEWRLVA